MLDVQFHGPAPAAVVVGDTVVKDAVTSALVPRVWSFLFSDLCSKLFIDTSGGLVDDDQIRVAFDRWLSLRVTKTLQSAEAVHVLDVANPFFTDLAAGVEATAGKAGLSVVLCNSNDDDGAQAAHRGVLCKRSARPRFIATNDAA